MPVAVSVVASGGIPIVDTGATGKGVPMTPVTAPVYGIPVTIVTETGALRAMPVNLVNDDLSDWTP